MNSEQKTNMDITFVGSGISSSFSILNLLRLRKENAAEDKLKMTIIEKYPEFYKGIPYGKRSGFSVLLINALDMFLPQPERAEYIEWLNQNIDSLLEEFRKDGGHLAEKWILDNIDSIRANNWDKLYVPRAFFGVFIEEKTNEIIEELSNKGTLEVNYITAEVLDIDETNGMYKLYLNTGEEITTLKVALALGSLPTLKLFNDQEIVEEENLLLVNENYSLELDNILGKIKDFASKREGKETNVVVVGANASGLELMYKMSDIEEIDSKINNFSFISTQGVLPDFGIDKEAYDSFKTTNLFALQERESLTAQEIADAAYKDLDRAEALNIGAATSINHISKGFGALLDKLNKEELENFTCFHGNQIGRRQRLAGIHYLDNIFDLKEKNRLDHITGRFSSVKKNSDNEYYLEYKDTATRENMQYNKPTHVLLNCVGSTNLQKDDVPVLIKNLIKKNLCKPNKSQLGFYVNDALEASKNLHIVGPLVAGNIIKNRGIWHVEHCGRIIWLSKILAESLQAEMIPSRN